MRIRRKHLRLSEALSMCTVSGLGAAHRRPRSLHNWTDGLQVGAGQKRRGLPQPRATAGPGIHLRQLVSGLRRRHCCQRLTGADWSISRRQPLARRLIGVAYRQTLFDGVGVDFVKDLGRIELRLPSGRWNRRHSS